MATVATLQLCGHEADSRSTGWRQAAWRVRQLWQRRWSRCRWLQMRRILRNLCPEKADCSLKQQNYVDLGAGVMTNGSSDA
eukprot:6175918-Pleurochrysis_carterae.AAC.3